MYIMYALVNSVNSMRLQSLVKKMGFKSAWGLNPSCGRAPIVRFSVVEGAVSIIIWARDALQTWKKLQAVQAALADILSKIPLL